MGDFPRYEGYKESGVEWLGEIPEHWEIGRLKLAIESCINGVWGNDPDENNKDDNIICFRVADFTRDNFRVSLNNLTSRKISKSDLQSRGLKAGDLLLEKSGGGEKQLVGQIVSYNYNFPAVCSNFIARLRIKSDFYSRFLAYVNAYFYAIQVNYKHIKQTTGIQNLDSNSYLSEVFAYPEFEEQKKIADFLDRKTLEIENAIAKKQRLIELLEEQKTILINQAVTKGLNPDVPMKDSGIEWIREIPEHWEVKKLKFILSKIEYGLSESALSDGEYQYLNMGHIQNGEVIVKDTGYLNNILPEMLLEKYDILFNRTNSFDLVGKSGIFRGSKQDKVTFASYLVRFRAKDNINPIWLSNVMNDANFMKFIQTLALRSLHQANLNPSRGTSVHIPVPQLEEQNTIAKYLSFQKEQYQININNAVKSIQFYQELKQILISQAVTGKIKI